jgi:hypothetical protein
MERMKDQEGLTSAGAFCPNEECRHYAQADEGNIIKFGKSKQGVQRYRCKRAAQLPSPPRAARSFIVSTLL